MPTGPDDGGLEAAAAATLRNLQLAPEVVTVQLADTTVAWVPARREFFALTPIATDYLDALAAGEADDLPIGLVADLASQLRDIGVLVDPTVPRPSAIPAVAATRPGPARDHDPAEIDRPSGQPIPGIVLGPYEALDHRFVVELPDAGPGGSDLRGLERELRHVLSSLANAPSVERPVRYRVSPGDRGPRLTVDGARLDAHPSVPGVLATLLWDVNQRAVASATDDVVLHAGAVVDQRGGAVVLPAAMEAGKTTLVTALVRAGLGYLSDELAALGGDGRVVRPYPKALSLDPGSWRLFPELAPAEDRRSMSPHQWLVTPDQVRPGAVHPTTTTLSLLVFPEHEPGSRTELHALTPVQALHRLASCVFGFDERPGALLPSMARLAESVPAHHLTVGDGVDDAVAAVRHLLADTDA